MYATISGTINATSGTFTGEISGSIITASTINIGSGTFSVTSSGALTATNATITGRITASSGTIGGWVIGSSSLYSSNGNTYLYSSGSIRFSDGTHFFAMGDTTNHPRASALNVVAENGISFYTDLTVDSISSSSNVGYLQYNSSNDMIHLGTYYTTGVYLGSDDAHRISLNGLTGNITLRTDTGSIYIRPPGNNGLQIYGSYNINEGYHTGFSGYTTVMGSLIRNVSLGFVNGICVYCGEELS